MKDDNNGLYQTLPTSICAFPRYAYLKYTGVNVGNGDYYIRKDEVEILCAAAKQEGRIEEREEQEARDRQ